MKIVVLSEELKLLVQEDLLEEALVDHVAQTD